MEKRKLTAIETLEANSIKQNRPYMHPADMIKHPRMCDTEIYLKTREHFACQLEWALDRDFACKVSVDTCYCNQSAGVYGGMYCVITKTTQGCFVQGGDGDSMIVNFKDCTIIRSL